MSDTNTAIESSMQEHRLFPPPAGFADTAGFGSPRLTDIAENLAEATNRVLVFALADVDALWRFTIAAALGAEAL